MTESSPDPSADDPLHGNRATELLRGALEPELPRAPYVWQPPTPEQLNESLLAYEVTRLIGRGEWARFTRESNSP